MNRRPLVVCALAGLLLGTPVVSRAIDSIAARERIGVRVGGLSTNDGLNDAYGTGWEITLFFTEQITRPLLLDWKTTPPTTLEAANLLAELLAEAQRQRPDLHALQAAAASAHAEAERARAARWPSLSLAANGGRSFFLEDDRMPSNSYSVGVTLSVPLFDGGRLAAEARAAERDAERLQAGIETQRSQVARAVTDAYHDVRHAQAQREGVAVQFDSASESALAAEARYSAGVGSLLELLTAQAALARAQQSASQADSEWLAAFSRLNHALGRLPDASPASQP